jgi:hypothetical protein
VLDTGLWIEQEAFADEVLPELLGGPASETT